jgi:hypothetical protein
MTKTKIAREAACSSFVDRQFPAFTTSHVPSQPNPNKQAAMPGPAASAPSAAAAEPDDAAGAVDRVVSAEALLALSAQIRASGNDDEEEGEMDDGEEEEPRRKSTRCASGG